MNKKNKEAVTYGIIGLGRFGMALALELAHSGSELLVIDHDEEKVRILRDYTENAYVLSSIDVKSLEATGIQNCDVAVVCIAEHTDVSILTTLHLVEMGIPKVISKAVSADHGKILDKLGAEVVFPERDMALRLANRLETDRVLDFVQFSEKINITKMRTPEAFVGKRVLDVNLRSRFGLNIIAIENDRTVIEVVQPEHVFSSKDVLYLAGSKDGLLKLSQWMERQ